MKSESEAKRLIIVSNRLPVKAEIWDEIIHFEKSAGGLATGLNSLDSSYEKHWIGWPGVYTDDADKEDILINRLDSYNFHPVFLSRSDVELYYDGYSNSTLWPLFHYFYPYARHDQRFWDAYKKVNRLFANRVLEFASEDDIIWVQDYHLMLLPSMLREKLPRVRIGFFLHIPFPSYELFRTLANRDELMEGVTGADQIGFHTYEYMRHFVSALYRIKGVESDDNRFHYRGHTFSVDTFPMGINYDSFCNAYKSEGVKRFAEEFGNRYHDRKVILTVDRLDYSKGILRRLEAFRYFLELFPAWNGKVSMVMILVPSRDKVDKYHELKVSIDEAVGNINGSFSSPGWIPIHYFYKNFSFEELAAFYHQSDVALVTPLRDGMNLVAKEYVAAKARKAGVLILSEMAGAAIQLRDALVVNPNNLGEIAGAINKALNMPVAEQRRRLMRMQRKIRRSDISKWSRNFINKLESIHQWQDDLRKKYLRPSQSRAVVEAFAKAERRLVALDYDGTLVPFAARPEDALPPKRLLKILESIAGDDSTDLLIVSGRDSEFLDSVIPGKEITVFAEHGAMRRMGSEWISLFRSDLSWQPEIIRVMKEITETTPGSMIERKRTAVVWHYRNSDTWLAEMRVAQLINRLIYPCTMRQLYLMKGNKIVEVKPSEYTKGTAVNNYIEGRNYDFILAAGDDTTDEDMFEVLPRTAATVKIGKPSERARFNMESSADFVQLLEQISR